MRLISTVAHSITSQMITFHSGSSHLLLRDSLVAAGVFSDETSLTVKITVANNVSIPQNSDSDPRYGLSDGNRVFGFSTLDRKNYRDYAPCFGYQAFLSKHPHQLMPILFLENWCTLPMQNDLE